MEGYYTAASGSTNLMILLALSEKAEGPAPSATYLDEVAENCRF